MSRGGGGVAQGGGHGRDGAVVAVGGGEGDGGVPQAGLQIRLLQIQQHGPGGDRRQLGGIAHQHQPGAGGEGLEQRRH